MHNIPCGIIKDLLPSSVNVVWYRMLSFSPPRYK